MSFSSHPFSVVSPLLWTSPWDVFLGGGGVRTPIFFLFPNDDSSLTSYSYFDFGSL